MHSSIPPLFFLLALFSSTLHYQNAWEKLMRLKTKTMKFKTRIQLKLNIYMSYCSSWCFLKLLCMKCTLSHTETLWNLKDNVHRVKPLTWLYQSTFGKILYLFGHCCTEEECLTLGLHINKNILNYFYNLMAKEKKGPRQAYCKTAPHFNDWNGKLLLH